MSIERFIPRAAAFALAVFTTAGLLGSVDRLARHEQHRAAAELIAESHAAQAPLQLAEVQHVVISAPVQRVVVTAHRQHA